MVDRGRRLDDVSELDDAVRKVPCRLEREV
jgi:hypothetical protein